MMLLRSAYYYSQQAYHRRKSMNNSTTATTSRLKGLIWVIGVVAAIFTLISLAPVISHFG
jgi:hypothetical protein